MFPTVGAPVRSVFWEQDQVSQCCGSAATANLCMMWDEDARAVP